MTVEERDGDENDSVEEPHAIREPRGEKFDDKVGSEPYGPGDIPPERELTTTPYDAQVKSLVGDIDEKTLIVNPEFQRLSVWDRPRKSRLIESLFLRSADPAALLRRGEGRHTGRC